MSVKVTPASVLAFERKIDPSDAIFYSGQWEDIGNSEKWPCVEVITKSMRCTSSSIRKTVHDDPLKIDKSLETPNLQTMDTASLPIFHDTLKIRFTVNILPGAGMPCACNSPSYLNKLASTVHGYIQNHGFEELAWRYASNFANARFLWRNLAYAHDAQVIVKRLLSSEEKQWEFTPLAYDPQDLQKNSNATLMSLGETIENGLRGEERVLLEVTAFVRMGNGQNVFPSQELILENSSQKMSNGKLAKRGRTLYQIGGMAAMHSQKLGNAIRTIDTWYLGSTNYLNPIPVEPYGTVTAFGIAYRNPGQKLDFYTLLQDWIIKDKAPPVEQQHYVMSTLIRGGVFGNASDE